MDPIEVEGQDGSRWRLKVHPKGNATAYRALRTFGCSRWEGVVDADSLPLLAMAIKEAGFRQVYSEAVDPLCKAIQERMGKSVE